MYSCEHSASMNVNNSARNDHFARKPAILYTLIQY